MLAHMMRDLAHASARDRTDHLREYLNYVHTGVIDRLQRQIEESTDAPIYWQADARAIVQANAKRLLAAGTAPRLAEWPETVDAAQCASALGTELDAMADACEHWPAMWRHAAEQGEGLLASVD
jgi:glycerol dehydrogenase-like iron-containing ADH family enzyme